MLAYKIGEEYYVLWTRINEAKWLGVGCFQATGTPKMQSQTDDFHIFKV
jgi:hypothetical protein